MMTLPALTSAQAAPAQGDSILITTRAPDGDYYSWVTYLSAGPPAQVNPAEGEVRARRYRVAVTTSEVFNQIYLERVSYGTEGCCAQLESVVLVDLEFLARQFGVRGELAGVRVQGWTYSNALIFILAQRRFELLIVDGEVWAREHAPLGSPGAAF